MKPSLSSRIILATCRPNDITTNIGGIQFGGAHVNLPNHQIKLPAKFSGYTVYINIYMYIALSICLAAKQ